MQEPEDRYFESARLRIHYCVWGDESKPALVMVHGGRDHARNWDFVADRLAGRYALYAIDLRGHGDSDWVIGGPYGLASYVADLAKLIDVLDRRQVMLLGHSLGGRIVMDYTSSHPERVSKAIAIEGFGRMGSERPPHEQLQNYERVLRDLEERDARGYGYATLEAAEARMQEENQRLSPEMVRHLTKHAVKRREDGMYVWKFDNYTRLTPAPEWDMDESFKLWSNIKTPVLFCGGAESWDKRFPGREVMADWVPGAQKRVFENAGHWVHHDQLEPFVAAVREFLG
jgi:pimeloyl-ACP methyl ester carboxylesterase